MLVINIDTIKKRVLMQSRNYRISQGIDAGGIDRTISVSGGGVEARTTCPATNRQHDFYLRILLFVLRQ